MFRQMEKEKREIRMEKIVSLLNEYEWQESWSYDKKYWIHIWWGDDLDYECFICSKKYWFIKWLVENKKIDKSKVFSFIDTADKPYEDILCLLALSDEPIEDLISFLK